MRRVMRSEAMFVPFFAKGLDSLLKYKSRSLRRTDMREIERYGSIDLGSLPVFSNENKACVK